MRLKKLGSLVLLRHKSGTNRYWEIDALRGIAIVMMVTYHLAYDLTLFGYYQANVFVGPWRAFARTTASLFILLAGGSAALSYARRVNPGEDLNLYRKYLSRGLILVGWGIVITLVTWAYMGKVVIIFGILHLIGTATILIYPFLSLRWANLVLGAAIIVLGVYLNQLPVQQPWLLLLGLRPRTLFQLDYFPLLPWFGVALVGVFFGQTLYPNGLPPRPRLNTRAEMPGAGLLGWLGQQSLVIYLVHQPILFTVLNIMDILGK